MTGESALRRPGPGWVEARCNEEQRLSRQFLHFRFRLLEPERHVHLAVHCRRGSQVLLGLLRLAHTSTEAAEATVAVSDERSHTARLGERQRPAVMRLAALGIEPVGMGRDVAEEVQGM